MQNLVSIGAFAKKCNSHSNIQVSHICINPFCQGRVLCSECKKTHDNTHLSQIIPIEVAVQFDHESKLQELESKAQDLGSLAPKHLEDLDIVFDKIKNSINSALDNLKEEFKSKLSGAKIVNEDKNIKEFREEYQNILDQCFNADSNNHDSCEILIQKFSQTFTELIAKSKYINRKKEKLLTRYSFALDRVDTLIESFMQCLEEFKRFFLKENQSEYLNELQDFQIAKLSVLSRIKTDNVVKTVEYIHDKSLFVTGDNKGFIHLWDGKSYKNITSLKAHDSWISSVKYRGQKEYILSCGGDSKINVIKMNKDLSLKIIETFEDHKEPILNMVLVDSKGYLFSAGMEPMIRVTDLKSLGLKTMIDTDNINATGQMIYLPDQDLLAVGLDQGIINLYELEKFNKMAQISVGHSNIVSCLAVVQEDNCLVAGVYSVKSVGLSYTVKTWKLDSDNFLESKEILVDGDYPVSIYSIENQSAVALVSNKGHLVKLDLNTQVKKQIQQAKSCSASTIDRKASQIFVVDFSDKHIIVFKY